MQWTTNDGGATSLQTTYVSATQIAAEVPASLLTDPGTAVLRVRNPDGSTSNIWPVNVVPHPVITQTNPTDGGIQMTIAAGSAAFSATLYGTGFASGAVVQWAAAQGTTGGPVTSLSTTYVSATQLIAQVPASLLTAAGSASLTLGTPTAAFPTAGRSTWSHTR